nr:uncharacterized protein LOC100181694 [Ciona intestinalis]|eukprot:XP_002131244.1 uncharacterized protein LOC100181694 [Ciona intestinalis]
MRRIQLRMENCWQNNFNHRCFVQVCVLLCILAHKAALTNASLFVGREASDIYKVGDRTDVIARRNISSTNLPVNQLVVEQHFRAENFQNISYCESKPKFKIGSGSILVYLSRLMLCQMVTGKPWLQDECSNRVYNVTSYYHAVYEKICNPQNFARTCGNSIEQTENGVFNDEAHDLVLAWVRRNRLREVATIVNATRRNEERRNETKVEYKYCADIQSFFQNFQSFLDNEIVNTTQDQTSDILTPFSQLNYSEWFLTYRPFCEPVACGISKLNYQSSPVTSYQCFSQFCRPAIVFTMVVDSVLAAIVVVTNFLVLAVSVRTTIMQNIPGYFKISLAIADIMVGLFVLPGSVYHHYVLSMSPLPFRSEGQSPHATDYFDQRYLNFMGVFTVMSFSVSIYTMGAASVDRYLAITKPFRYRQGKYLTKKRSIIVFMAIWAFGFICAIYPVFTKRPYDISGLSLILSTGLIAAVIYAVTMGLPLLAVWVINGMMLRQVCTDGKNRRTLSAKRRRNQQQARPDTAEGERPENQSGKANVTHSNGTTKSNFEQAAKRRVSQFAISLHAKLRRQSRPSQTGTLSHENVEEKLAKTLAVMIGAFTIALLPSIIILALGVALDKLITPARYPATYSPYATNFYNSAQFVASRLLLSNSFWNCIIYSVRNRHFRRALADVFICTEEARRRRRRSASMGGYSSSSYRHSQANRQKSLSKMASTDSSYTTSEAEKRRRSTHVWDLSTSTVKDRR